MKLYDYLPSGNSYKVRLVCAKLGLPYTHVPVNILEGESRTPEFLAMNPAGQIPLLVLDDGRTLAESNAIIQYLASIPEGGTDLVPADDYDRAKMQQWMFWEQYRHEPAIAVARFINHYYSVERASELPSLLEKGEAALEVMEGHLARHDWFVGDSCTLADVSLYAYTHVADEGGFDLAQFPYVQAWLARFSAQDDHIGMDWVPES